MNRPPPPPPPSAATPLYFQPPPDLPTALSTLTSLLYLSTSTLHSLPIPTTATTTLLPCPFNPNHHLPPSSLFSHHLSCPFPLCLPNLHYPHTLYSTTPPPSLPSTTSTDLYFSLENYVGDNNPANKFFYENCPAPVTPTFQSLPLLAVPRVLYIECAEYSKHPEQTGFPVNFIRFLPSEIWAITSEIESWNGGASVFSIRILRSILRLRYCELSHLSEWIVARSPKYGVIIDFALRDHLLLMVRLCLKAIVREAFGLVGHLFGDEGSRMEEIILSTQLSQRSFECPILGEVLMWLALQLGVLYGQVNGTFFAVEVMKECIIDSAMGASLFPLEEIGLVSQNVDSEVKEQGQKSVLVDDCNKNATKNVDYRTIQGSVISISQVAAAVAALHERSRMEEKIRSLREAPPLSAYQRNVEHAYLSKIADEERQKRPNYRPIIEHDGLLWQRSHNQDTNKLKTREELLAEERDYKRRRMSYRGKKLKRNTVEVMRDIIVEYMEEIKQSGGIGNTSDAMHEVSASSSKNFLESANNVSESRNNHEVSEKHGGPSHDYRKKQSSRLDYQGSEDDIHQSAPDTSQDHELRDFNRNVKKTRSGSNHYLESNDETKSSSHSKEHRSRKTRDFEEGKSYQRWTKLRMENDYERERFEDEHKIRKKERDERDQISDKRERDEDNWEYRDRRGSKSKRDSRKRDGEDVGNTDIRRSKTNRYSSSTPELYNDFGDRYDPAESRDFNEDDH